jgi:L-aminopeptidase/D-esterase-like protein
MLYFVALGSWSLGGTRARDLGVPFDGEVGTYNAITDVAGVEVGHVTLISGSGPLKVGKGPVRTGVTAVLPRGKSYSPVFAAWYSLNGNGEMTGTTWVEESGFLEGPVMITNTHSVGVVRDAVVSWSFKNKLFSPLEGTDIFWALPVVAETYDGMLNDINGFHVKEEHVFRAFDNAATGPVGEGNVGGGTAMVCHDFKGGIGTSSRIVSCGDSSYTVGALVQANYGFREDLLVAGVPVGREIPELMPQLASIGSEVSAGSIIVVLATDAPLMPHQLKRMARRIPIGIGRVGGYASNGSGDIFIAFSTANNGAFHHTQKTQLKMLPNDLLNPLFLATVQATEEAIVNALVAAETMKGRDDNVVYALPHERLQEVLKKFNRLAR